ncbi:MAG: tRNA uracil 4-sulfurtransferase ThiI, partial [Anaerolineae bacterium]
HYGELGLKGKNRPRFLNALRNNILNRLAGLDVRPGHRRSGRLVLRLGPSAAWPEIESRLRTVFGIAYFGRAWSVPLSLPLLEKAILAHLPPETGITFSVRTRRPHKDFRHTSQEVNRRLGTAIRRATGWGVNLNRPDLTVHVEIVYQEIFFYFERVPGAKGLPVGTGGKVLNLLSGGIDSPVAAWYMLKRGCHVLNIHFHGYPLTSRTSEVKAIELARVLTAWGGSARLYSVPIGRIQAEIMKTSLPDYRVVLYRRLMVRVAGEIARREGALALVTGESLGQVASQTMHNIRAIEQAANLPILRPLIGLDKDEIIDRARQINTFALSNIPGEDCCTLFTPRHPVTAARVEMIETLEAQQPWDAWLQQALAEATLIDVQASPVDVLQLQPDLLENLPA